MSDITPRLGLPLLAAGQAQKELFHNEALALLDAAALATVVGVGLDSPPEDAAIGSAWIVGDAPAGDWEGRARAIAVRSEGGWRFLAPAPGMVLRQADTGEELRFDGTAWRRGDLLARRLIVGGTMVVGMQQPGVSTPVGGSVVDTEARAAITALISSLAAHGLIAR